MDGPTTRGEELRSTRLKTDFKIFPDHYWLNFQFVLKPKGSKKLNWFASHQRSRRRFWMSQHCWACWDWRMWDLLLQQTLSSWICFWDFRLVIHDFDRIRLISANTPFCCLVSPSHICCGRMYTTLCNRIIKYLPFIHDFRHMVQNLPVRSVRVCARCRQGHSEHLVRWSRDTMLLSKLVRSWKTRSCSEMSSTAACYLTTKTRRLFPRFLLLLSTWW